MKKYYFLLISVFIFSGALVLAQPADISFPVAELENCGSEAECMAYCDLPENMGACLDFAESHNLMPPEEIAIARAMLAAGQTEGPGGCQGMIECESYCDNMDHLSECLAFAEQHGLIPPEELEEAKMVARAIEQGVEPPNCNSKTECDAYCSSPENMEECMVFAIAAGLVPEDEVEEMQMMLQAIRAGVPSPACMSEEECDVYCSAPEHLEECITFAVAAGFMTAEEAEMVKLTGGKGPGDCRGKEECENYCEDPAHAEDCMNFALEYGLMSPEDAENYQRMLDAGFTSGPGGCQGEEECEVYCDDAAHMEECIDFAEKMGFMSSEDVVRARKMGTMGGPGDCKGEEQCRAFCDNPANMEECMNFAVQIGDMTIEEAAEARQGMDMMRRGGGPGGCQSERECMMYCENPAYMEECMNFAMEMGMMSPEEAQHMKQMMEGGMQSGGMMPSDDYDYDDDYMQRGETQSTYEEIQRIKEMEMEKIIQEQVEREMKAMEEMMEKEQKQEMGTECAPGANQACGSEVGSCQIGIQVCQNGFWGECFGGRGPVAEMCDGVDNDCDGQTDEDNICGGGQSLFDQAKNFLAGLITLD